jgi:transcriptional regulator with XRE-family HTH domain
MNGIDYGERFERFREIYRRPDGKKWSNMDIERATGGFVRGNYITNLKAGRIEQPGIDRLAAIAQVMGFPTELWFHKDREPVEEVEAQKRPVTLADKLNLLFEVRINHTTGRPFTNRELAELTYGQLDEETITAAREGKVADLRGAQYVALSNVFGVDVSYWYSQPGELPPLDPDTVTALRNEKARAALNKFNERSSRQQDLILSLLDQLAEKEKDVEGPT